MRQNQAKICIQIEIQIKICISSAHLMTTTWQLLPFFLRDLFIRGKT